MEEIEEYILNIENKISKLNDFIALSLRRNNMFKEFDKIAEEVVKARDILTEAHELMQLELNSLKHEYEDVMSQMRKKQLVVIGYVIKEKRRKIKEDEDEKNLIQSCGKSNLQLKVPGSAAKSVVHKSNSINLNRNTPKIKIPGYKESPFRKKNPFQIEEFDVSITQQQFDTIPKYMCGRETLDQLNSFLETVIIPCFNEKYKLIQKERSCLKNINDLELRNLYIEQASLLPGRAFITPGDLNRKLNKMLDKKNQNRLVMLRHIGILNEVRIKQTVCFAWTNNGLK